MLGTTTESINAQYSIVAPTAAASMGYWAENEIQPLVPDIRLQ